MHTFEDLRGKKWNLSLTVSAVRRVRSSLALDLYDLGDEGFINATKK